MSPLNMAWTQIATVARLSAVVLNSRGHSALEVEFNNRLDPPAKAECHFYLSYEPATLNLVGKQLIDWVGKMENPFECEWKII